jgi:hypothetical protein
VKLHGCCETCGRIRRVDVNGHQLALYAATGRIPSGECDECRETRERPTTRRSTR